MRKVYATTRLKATEGTVPKKKRVAGDDKVGLGGKRTGKHMIVIGVVEHDGGDRCRMHELRKLRIAQNQSRRRKRLLCESRGKLLALQNALEFDEQRGTCREIGRKNLGDSPLRRSAAPQSFHASAYHFSHLRLETRIAECKSTGRRGTDFH